MALVVLWYVSVKPFPQEAESCENLKSVCQDPIELYKDRKKMPIYPNSSRKEASGKWDKSQCETFQALSLPTSALSLKGLKNTKSVKKNHY